MRLVYFLKSIQSKIIFFIIFILIFTAFTFPLIFKFDKVIPGFFSSDESFVSLWDSWRIKNSFIHNLRFYRTDFIAHPFGIDLYSAGFMPYLWLFVLYSLSLLFSPVLTYNLQILANYFLTAIFVFMLIKYISKSERAALFGSLIFTFCPYLSVRSWQHIGLTYTQWLPLSFWVLFRLRSRPNFLNKALVLISFLFVLSFEWSLMLMSIISISLFILYQYLYQLRKYKGKLEFSQIKYLETVFALGFFSLAILLPQFYPIIKNIFIHSSSIAINNNLPSAWNAYFRPFEDLFVQSVRPLSYFLPAVTHPLFGGFTGQFIGTKLYGMSLTEHTLYLGWVPLSLAFIAIRVWRNKKRELKEEDGFYIGFFILLLIVAWLFSQPPWWKIGPIKFYMPSFFMYKLLPMFRAYCRFGILVMFAVAVLAGFGLKFILERFKSHKTKITITALACILVLFEFWNWPPFKVIDVSKVPAVYYWLREQPEDFVIAEYPLDINGVNEMFKFYQTKHEKKIINGTIPGTYANKVAQTITKLSYPNTAGVLKWMGVKYVIVHKEDYLTTGLIDDREELGKIPKNAGLKLAKSFTSQECPQKDIMCVRKTGPIDVYEVVAASKNPEAIR
ncbi:hypothetical protein ACFL1K_00360 [Candidatus Omnitrophota bacterium]